MKNRGIGYQSCVHVWTCLCVYRGCYTQLQLIHIISGTITSKLSTKTMLTFSYFPHLLLLNHFSTPFFIGINTSLKYHLKMSMQTSHPAWYDGSLPKAWDDMMQPGSVFYLCLRTCLETVLAKTVLRHVLDRWRCRFSISVLDRRSFFKFKFKFLLTH